MPQVEHHVRLNTDEITIVTAAADPKTTKTAVHRLSAALTANNHIVRSLRQGSLTVTRLTEARQAAHTNLTLIQLLPPSVESEHMSEQLQAALTIIDEGLGMVQT